MNHKLKIDLPISLRALEETDKAYIIKTWIQDYSLSEFARRINKKIYRQHQKWIVTKLFKNAKFIIICHEEIQDEMMGFMCFRELEEVMCVDYLYIKPYYRNMGLGKMLMQVLIDSTNKPIFYSHQTKCWSFFRNFKAQYDPYLLMGETL